MTGPFVLLPHQRQDTVGNLGIPAHGIAPELVPQGDRLEARVESPSVAPGYSRNPALSPSALDEEGVHHFGDAMRFALRGDPAAGLVFDGRPAENFKLASGSRVAVGPLGGRFTGDLAAHATRGPPDRDRA